MYNLSMMTFSSPPPHLVRTHRKASASKRKVNRLLLRQNSTQLTFFKIPKILRARFRCMTSFTSTGQPFYLRFLFWHQWTTHPPRACVNTCAQVCTELTHVLSRKVLSLTKPKDKIYKTKSLGYYITLLLKKVIISCLCSSISLRVLGILLRKIFDLEESCNS